MQTPFKSVAMDSLAVGDTVTFTTEVRVGDIIVLVEGSLPGQFYLSAVTVEEAAKYEGPKYRAVRGAVPGTYEWAPIELEASGKKDEQLQHNRGHKPVGPEKGTA